MSQFISIASALEKARIESDVPYLVALDVDVVNPDTGAVVETIHFVRNSENVTIAGTEYVAVGFDITFKTEAGGQPQVSLTVDEITGALQAYMEQYGGGVGFNVTMHIVNGAELDGPPELSEYFQITAATAAEYSAQFVLGAENETTKTFPRRRQTKDYCQWRYKDSETCRYAGALETCDLTLQGANGCAAHGNTINFGAYPGMSTNGVRYG
jgi:phage-related protein